jgi:glutamate-5-semialdehyde dehydrogenase
MKLTEEIRKARKAGYALAASTVETRNTILRNAAANLRAESAAILEANRKDMKEAQQNKLAGPLLKRLLITEKKLEQMAVGLESLASLPDPLGQLLSARELDRKLILRKVTVPIGVVGVIFESRPDALVQIAGLGIKSGNAVILKGGSEALHSNRILFSQVNRAVKQAGETLEGVLIQVESRQEIKDLLALDEYIDLMIPRGSNALVKFIQENTKIPVMGHADGICHQYIDGDCDADMAVSVAVDSKTQYPAVCNAMETLLIHRSRAEELLPRLSGAMSNVEFRGDASARQIIDCAPAEESDWDTEYTDYILAVKVVDSVDEAIDHINSHGSHHTDGIITRNEDTARRFFALVDSSSCIWNASTRFADGFRYGLGAEVGISTGKIHARGPVGLEGLCTYKYLVEGSGQIVKDYAEGRSHFTHKDLL